MGSFCLCGLSDPYASRDSGMDFEVRDPAAVLWGLVGATSRVHEDYAWVLEGSGIKGSGMYWGSF